MSDDLEDDTDDRPDADPIEDVVLPGAGGTDPDRNATAMHFWDDVIDDLEATVREYRENDWETLALHPGDVTAIPGDPDDEADRYGLDLLVPDNEFTDLQELLAGGVSFDSYQVYRAVHDGTAFVVVAMEDTDAKTAVVYPAYYDLDDPAVTQLLDRARQEGELRSYLRVLTGDYVELTHDDPSLFAPEEEG